MNGIMAAMPSSRNSRLPTGTRRAVALECAVAMIASRPLPRFAPSTRPSATGIGSMPDAASVAMSSTIARPE